MQELSGQKQLGEPRQELLQHRTLENASLGQVTAQVLWNWRGRTGGRSVPGSRKVLPLLSLRGAAAAAAALLQAAFFFPPPPLTLQQVEDTSRAARSLLALLEQGKAFACVQD